MYSTPVLILLVLIVVVFARGTWRAINKDKESASLVKELSLEAQELEARQNQLEQGIARLQTEEGINEELRSKFNVTQEGEQFVVLVDEPEREKATSTESRSLFDKWWSGLRSLWP